MELLNSQYEDLASRMDPAILEAADMPMDIRSSNPTTFRIGQQFFQQVPIVPASAAPKATPAQNKKPK